MKEHAANIGAEAFVQLNNPDTGYRQFGCYKTWADALQHLSVFQGQRRHLYEIIPDGKPCKPYLDLERDEGLPAQFSTTEEFVAAANALIQRIFELDYGLTLDAQDIIWLTSCANDDTTATQQSNSNKVSFHVIISTHKPQYVYSSNSAMDPKGASHLAVRCKQLDPDGVGALVDCSVYTRDREMRSLGSCKYENNTRSFKLLQPPDVDITETLITHLDALDARQKIEVPVSQPHVFRKERRPLRTVAEAAQTNPEQLYGITVARMLSLLTSKLHPTAYVQLKSKHAANDPDVGIKFGYTDRTEPCYTSLVHEHTQNVRCFVDAAGDIHVKCMSDRCRHLPPMLLGPLWAESSSHLSHATFVDTQYLTWAPPTDGLIDSAEPIVGDEVAKLNVAVQKFIRGDAHSRCAQGGTAPDVLSIKSPMGTGKSTWMNDFLSDCFSRKPQMTVLLVSYRQSLTCEHMRKLGNLGFVSYLDYMNSTNSQPDVDLSNRKQFPRVVCQIESLWRISPPMSPPVFDMIILDEVESVLRHFTSTTVPRPSLALNNLIFALQAAASKDGVVTMDATWGAATAEILERANLKNLLVVNTTKPTESRTFSFTNDEEGWVSRIVDDLASDKNVVVPCLSATKATALKQLIVEKGALEEADIMLHTSLTDDSFKKELCDVDKFWSRYRLVIYSPTIAAGVDFSREHFDRMYFYACINVAPPATAMQMLFRVRKLRDKEVFCCVSPFIRLNAVSTRPPMVSRMMMDWLRWMDQAITGSGEDSRSATTLADSEVVRIESSDLISPATAILPKITHWHVILSYAKAEQHNGNENFMREFRLLAEAGHHKVTVSSVVEKASSTLTGDALAQQMLQVVEAGLPEGEALDALKLRIRRNQASEQDKLVHKVIKYQSAWGVDTIDASFLEKHGTADGSSQVKLLSRLLCPDLRCNPAADVHHHEKNNMLRLPHIEAVVSGLGLKSVFDTETVITDLMQVFDQRLKDSAYIKDYKNTCKLFSRTTRNNDGKTWDKTCKVLNAVNIALNAVGLALERMDDKQVRITDPVTGVRKTISRYRLDTSMVAEMKELVKLRLGRAVGVSPQNAHARQALEECALSSYAHLLTTKPADARDPYLFVDDD